MDIIRPITPPSRQDTTRQVRTPSIKRSRMKSLGLALVSILAVGLLGLIAWYTLRPSAQPLNANQYQVVYLTGGQMFFGKLQNTDGDYLYMKSPYTAQSTTASADDKTKAAEPTTTLLRVKDQLYGPDDTVAVKSSQVVFWQNLRDDSKVTQALKSKQ